jgi:hypothetical protein
MANMINKKPKNETIGPTVMRRKLKISGLNSTWVEEPVIRKKPITIIANPDAISTKFILPSPDECLFSITLKNLVS